jgi:signal transduction histidine kinase
MSLLFLATFFFYLIEFTLVFPGQTFNFTSHGFYISWKLRMLLNMLPLVLIPGKFSRSILAQTKSKLEVSSSVANYVSREVILPLDAMTESLAALRSKFATIPEAARSDLLALSVEMNESLELVISMINNVSTIEQLEKNLLSPLHKSKVRLCTFIQNSLRILSIPAKRKQITLDFSACFNQDNKSFTLDLDPAKVALALRNLVANAIKFSPQSGNVAISFRIVAEELEYDTLSFRTLSDTIMRRSMHRIFDESGRNIKTFVRIQVADNGQGTPANILASLKGGEISYFPGLGLKICQKIAAMHNGRIGAFSTGEPGDGSIFYIDLPYSVVNPSSSVNSGTLPVSVYGNDLSDVFTGVSPSTLYHQEINISGSGGRANEEA